MTTYTKKAFFGFAWITVGTIVMSIFGYLLRVMIARNLSVAMYGLVYAVPAMFGIVGVFTHLGIPDAITKYIAGFSVKNEQKRMKEVLVQSARILYTAAFFVAILGYIFAEFLGQHYFHDPLAPLLIRIYAIAMLLQPVNFLAKGFLAGSQHMEFVSIFESIRSLSQFFFTWLLLGLGAVGVMLAFPITQVVIHIVFAAVFLRFFPNFFKINGPLSALTKPLKTPWKRQDTTSSMSF